MLCVCVCVFPFNDDILKVLLVYVIARQLLFELEVWGVRLIFCGILCDCSLENLLLLPLSLGFKMAINSGAYDNPSSLLW